MRSVIFLVLFLLITTIGFTQNVTETKEFWFEGDITYKLNNRWALPWAVDFRWNAKQNQPSLYSLTVGGEYSIFKKHLKLGLFYRYFLEYDFENPSFFHENRFFADITGRFKITNFVLQNRVRFQTTDYFSPFDPISESTNYIRNKLSASYKINQTNFKIKLSTDFFWHLNGKDGTTLKQIRAIGSIEWNKNQYTVEISGIRNKELNRKNIENAWVIFITLGVELEHSTPE